MSTPPPYMDNMLIVVDKEYVGEAKGPYLATTSFQCSRTNCRNLNSSLLKPKILEAEIVCPNQGRIVRQNKGVENKLEYRY